MFRRFWWLFLVMLPIGAMAGLFVAAIITYVMPKMYESEAVIEVRPGFIQEGGSPPGELRITPQFFATEFERIKSRNALENVSKNLELTNRWAMDQETVVQNLKKMIVTLNIRGTDLISIKVRHTNKLDARDIANEVARNYKEWRNEIERKDAELIAEEASIGPAKNSVMIHEDAVIPNVPISPNVALNLSLGTILGLLISPFMAMPLMWILNRTIKAK